MDCLRMKTNQLISYSLSLIFICLSFISSGQGQNSVLSSGEWFKIGITEEGIYKIDRGLLQKMGLETSSLDPRSIALFGYGGGMLPQENAADRPEDLPEVAIMVSGEDDGSFDGQDYVLFYGRSPDLIKVRADEEILYQNNLYSDTTYYFLTVKNSPGKRVNDVANEGLNHPSITEFDDYRYLEDDFQNFIKTGREMYSPSFTTREIDFPLNGLVASSAIKITSALMAASGNPSSFDLNLNGFPVGNQQVGIISGAIYDSKGIESRQVFEIAPSDIQNTQEGLELTINFKRASSGTSAGYLNYVILEFARELKLYKNSTFFRSKASIQNQFSTYSIQEADNSAIVWDITDPFNALNQEFDFSNNLLQFGSSSQILKEFVVFSGNDFQKPDFLKRVENQNIRGISVPDGVIITHQDFLSEAQRLASFRASNDQLDVAVVTVEQVYNEFSSGRQDLSAIRDFIKYLYDRNQKLKYALLFGDGSYAYKQKEIQITADVSVPNTNYVPIYEARNSLHPIFSYSSDDYFGFMDEDEGFWEETREGDHLLDVGIGRLPVTSLADAKIVVDKLIRYVTEESQGDWRNEVYFVADDGDFNIHQRDADVLATFVDQEFSSFNPNKIYLDAFPQTPTGSGQTAGGVTDAINDAITKGALLFNFTGHGNEYQWCGEKILEEKDINSWTNRDKLPLFITATCEFGKYDNPELTSGGELLLLNENGGAIGLLTTSRPVFSNTNFLLNRAFYDNVFKKEEGQFPRLGDIIRKTKNESLRGPVNRNFALLGDPMMTLAYPQLEIEINELNGKDLTSEGDTIQALGLTTFKGTVVDGSGNQQGNYNGTLSVKVFDKPDEVTTLGNESNPTIFEQRNSVIFRGDVTITNGDFEFQFVVPKNISYLFKEGKVSLYARSDNSVDANGANINLKIGGTDQNAGQDNTPPELGLFLNNESFNSGDETGSNPLLIANLFDENGINISEGGVGQNISARLDDDDPINLNAFYSADLDSYQSGSIRYSLNGLEVGKHQLTLKVFDTHNNPSEKTIEFFVGEGAKNSISGVISYPNPVRDRTTITFSHNRISENLDVTVQIIDLRGDLVRTIKADIFDTTGTINGLTWDRTDNGGSRVKEGIYFVRILMRANDGVGVAHQKLIVID